MFSSYSLKPGLNLQRAQGLQTAYVSHTSHPTFQEGKMTLY